MSTETDIQAFVASAEVLHHCSGLIFKFARQELTHRLREAGIDLSPHHFFILLMIQGHGQKQTLTLTEISHKMDLDPSTLAPVIESLVRRGLLQRERDPNDRRRAPLTVTQAGTDLLKLALERPEESFLVGSLQQLGIEKSQQLTSLLQELTASFPNCREQNNQA